MKYGKFVFEHVKKGEMPWTQWYCSGLVNGVEVRCPFHFLFASVFLGLATLVLSERKVAKCKWKEEWLMRTV